MVLGGGTIADLIPRQQRGTAMAVWMMGPSKLQLMTVNSVKLTLVQRSVLV